MHQSAECSFGPRCRPSSNCRIDNFEPYVVSRPGISPARIAQADNQPDRTVVLLVHGSGLWAVRGDPVGSALVLVGFFVFGFGADDFGLGGPFAFFCFFCFDFLGYGHYVADQRLTVAKQF